MKDLKIEFESYCRFWRSLSLSDKIQFLIVSPLILAGFVFYALGYVAERVVLFVLKPFVKEHCYEISQEY